MSNSNLVSYTKISPNKTSPRNHKIDTITIHCFVGQITAKSGCNASHFVNYNPKRGASCNYVVGCDGSVGLCVEEKDRSWCSSNAKNDNRAITIEVASDTVEPYAVTDKAMKALIELVTDICMRNNIKELKWKADKSLIGQVDKQNMTVHRWFATKSCPGNYLYNKHSYIASEVNKKLGVNEEKNEPQKNESYIVQITASVLNVREGAGTGYRITTQVKKNQKYTIVEEKCGWGKLKSGAGWISLAYTKKV